MLLLRGVFKIIFTTWIGFASLFDNKYPELIEIGSNVVISSHVKILAHSDPPISLKNFGIKHKTNQTIIYSNVYIGAGSIILPGVTINEFSIIGAGSVKLPKMYLLSLYMLVTQQNLLKKKSINKMYSDISGKTLIFIPAYNESKYINKVIKNCKKFFKNILIVDDGSNDNTLELIEKFENILVIKHCINCGQGTAISTGLQYFLITQTFNI